MRPNGKMESLGEQKVMHPPLGLHKTSRVHNVN
jgi:hypothetical protein